MYEYLENTVWFASQSLETYYIIDTEFAEYPYAGKTADCQEGEYKLGPHVLAFWRE